MSLTIINLIFLKITWQIYNPNIENNRYLTKVSNMSLNSKKINQIHDRLGKNENV